MALPERDACADNLVAARYVRKKKLPLPNRFCLCTADYPCGYPGGWQMPAFRPSDGPDKNKNGLAARL
jgi:hypothetical protein